VPTGVTAMAAAPLMKLRLFMSLTFQLFNEFLTMPRLGQIPASKFESTLVGYYSTAIAPPSPGRPRDTFKNSRSFNDFLIEI